MVKDQLRQFVGWVGVIGILMLGTAMPALADGGGWPTATPTTTPALMPDSNLSPVLAITPIGNERPLTLENKFDIEADPAMAPQANPGGAPGAPIVVAQSQETNQSSSSILIIGVAGLVICVGLVGFLLVRMRRRGQ
jgi:hypothetical protein